MSDNPPPGPDFPGRQYPQQNWQPPQPLPPPAYLQQLRPSRRYAGFGTFLIVGAGLLLVTALVLSFVRIAGVTIAEGHAICSGFIGQLGQGFSSQVANDCSLIGVLEQVKGLCFIGAPIALVVGLYGWSRRSS